MSALNNAAAANATIAVNLVKVAITLSASMIRSCARA
jgi:hypothetical protein